MGIVAQRPPAAAKTDMRQDEYAMHTEIGEQYNQDLRAFAALPIDSRFSQMPTSRWEQLKEDIVLSSIGTLAVGLGIALIGLMIYMIWRA